MIIAGKLTTSVGSAIQWATITFDPPSGNSIKMVTDGDGNYSYDVPAGTYRVFIKGKYDVNQKLLGENVVVAASGTTSLESLLDQGIPTYSVSDIPTPSILGVGRTAKVSNTNGLLHSIGKAFLGVIYRNNTPVSSANSAAANFQTPVAGFTIPAGAMDKDSTLIIDMTVMVFDTVSATRIVRVFADTQQIAAYPFTSTSGLIPMQFRMSNCGDAGAQLQSSGLSINGTEQSVISTRQVDTVGHPVEITITVETPSGQMIKQALFAELK